MRVSFPVRLENTFDSLHEVTREPTRNTNQISSSNKNGSYKCSKVWKAPQLLESRLRTSENEVKHTHDSLDALLYPEILQIVFFCAAEASS